MFTKNFSSIICNMFIRLREVLFTSSSHHRAAREEGRGTASTHCGLWDADKTAAADTHQTKSKLNPDPIESLELDTPAKTWNTKVLQRIVKYWERRLNPDRLARQVCSLPFSFLEIMTQLRINNDVIELNLSKAVNFKDNFSKQKMTH